MKRDLDLVREICRQIEAQPHESFPIFLQTDTHDKQTISAHVQLLAEGGYIEADMWEGYWMPSRLTWQGHEFIALSANDKNWKKAISILLSIGKGITVPALTKLLESMIESQVILPGIF